MSNLLELRGLLDRAEGLHLDAAAYVTDFEERFWRIDHNGFWKLECLQHYQESCFASWEAFENGDWELSLRLIEQSHAEIEQQLAKVSAAGISHHRARVISEPVSPYVQWELHILNAKDQRGENVAMLTVEQAAALVGEGTLPDLVVLGNEAVYDIHCTEEGSPNGATRYADPAVVSGAREFVQQLHRAGERLTTYFPQEIADLGAPER